MNKFSPIEPQQDPMGKLANMVVNTSYEDIPSEVIEIAKKAIFDTLAVTIAGSGWQIVPAVADMVRHWGGRPESTVLIYGNKVPAPMAALVNGTMARSIDMGDVHEQGGHVSEWVVPTLLSALGIAPQTITGKEFLTAYIVAAELGIRVNACFKGTSHAAHGFPGEFNGPFYCTAATARLLKLSTEQTWNALGIAYSTHSLSEMQKYAEGTQMVRLQHGFSGDTAIKACLLAQQGATGPKGILLGLPGGALRHIAWDGIEPNILTDNLGKSWMLAEGLSLKPYASCKYTHSFIEATRQLINNHALDWREIAAIECRGSAGSKMTFEPADAKWNPASAAEAMYSTPYTVATAAITGSVFLDAFSEAEIARSDKRELMKRITVVCDPDITDQFEGFSVAITMNNGKQVSAKSSYVLGHSKNPMAWADLEAKFWQCVPFAAKSLEQEKLTKLVLWIKELESLLDSKQLIYCLTMTNRISDR